MKRTIITNTSLLSVAIEDLQAHLPGQGSFVTVMAELAERSESLKSVAHLVRVESVVEPRATSIRRPALAPKYSAPTLEPESSEPESSEPESSIPPPALPLVPPKMGLRFLEDAQHVQADPGTENPPVHVMEEVLVPEAVETFVPPTESEGPSSGGRKARRNRRSR